MFGSCFLKLFSVLKNEENKKNGKNTFGLQFFFFFCSEKQRTRKTLNSNNNNIFHITTKLGFLCFQKMFSKTRRTRLIHFFFFFLVMKNTENTKFK